MAKRKYANLQDCNATDEAPKLARLPASLLDSARVEEDRRQNDRGEQDRRREERATVDAKASLRASMGAGVKGHLDDLSVYGCKLQLPLMSFNVGDSVWFKIDSITPWKGTVRWVEKDSVGVEFDRPFYPAVFELIVHSHKSVTCSKAA